MTPDQLRQVSGNQNLIARIRVLIYALGIAAAFVMITIFRYLREL
jgi:hypothetical protein